MCDKAVILRFDDSDKVVLLVFQLCFSGHFMLENIVWVLGFELCYVFALIYHMINCHLGK